jgi:predicted RNase H-like nuclease
LQDLPHVFLLSVKDECGQLKGIEKNSMLAGIDGYKKGWIAAVELKPGKMVVRTYPNFRAILDDGSLTLIVIDIPIGLPDHGARACDVEARRLLGRARGSSVFPTPIRIMLDAGTWEEACRRRLEQEGKKCSKQVAGILPKIHEVDQGMTPATQHRVREGHPELCFAMMNQGKPMSFNKRMKKGQEERLRLLLHHFADITMQLRGVSGARADIIDAYACLWTARRVAQGKAVSLTADTEVDSKGLKAEIMV